MRELLFQHCQPSVNLSYLANDANQLGADPISRHSLR